MILPTSSLSGQLYCTAVSERQSSLLKMLLARLFASLMWLLKLNARSAHPVTAYRPNGSSDFCHWGSRFRFQAHDPTHGAIHNHIHWLDHQVSVLVHRYHGVLACVVRVLHVSVEAQRVTHSSQHHSNGRWFKSGQTVRCSRVHKRKPTSFVVTAVSDRSASCPGIHS